METQVFQTNPRLRGLLLILIFTFAASGIVLTILSQIQAYHREQIYLATQSALPRHRVRESDKTNGTDKSNMTNWLTYHNEEYGFEIKHPIDWILVDRKNFGASNTWVILLNSPDNKLGFGISVESPDKPLPLFVYTGDKKEVLLNEVPYDAYIFPHGYECYGDEPRDCSEFYIPIKNLHGSYFFSGSGGLETGEIPKVYLDIFSTFKFIK